MIPARRSWIVDDLDRDGLHVFIPGAMGAGILLSLGILISDAYGKAGGRRLAERRTALTARATATDVISGPGTTMAAPVGLRRPTVYVIATAAFLGLTAALFPGTTWNYFDPDGYIKGIAWLWAIGVVAAIFFARVGFIVAQAIPRFVPIIAAAVGLGVAARFTLFADTVGWRVGVGLGLFVATAIAVAVAGYGAKRVGSLPARAWRLFVSTPLSREEAPAEEPLLLGNSDAGPRRTNRVLWDGLRLAGGLVALTGAIALLADPPAIWETAIFRGINSLPRGLDEVVWAIQRIGSSAMIPIAGAALWLLARRWQPPAALLASAILLGWLAVQGLQEVSERGRPAALFDDAVLGISANAEGVGFPSGHAVVVFMLATVLSPYVLRKVRWSLYGIALLVAVTRVYVGAHLPLDVIGGAALGIIAGTAVNLASRIRVQAAAAHSAERKALDLPVGWKAYGGRKT